MPLLFLLQELSLSSLQLLLHQHLAVEGSQEVAWLDSARRQSEAARRRKPTSQAIWAAFDLKRRRWLGCVPALPTFAYASFSMP